MRCLRALLPSAVFLLSVNVYAQAVISARSGVVHFSEGDVFLDDQPLDHKVGSFPNIKEGSTLRTERGRAEVLLTPGVFLRLDDNSGVRMRSTALNDTRVDFVRGVIIVDTMDALSDNHVTLTCKDSQIRFVKQGVYRLDYDTATVQAYSGEAEIAHDGKTSKLDDAHLFFLTLDLTTKKLDAGTDDEFYDWARDRSNSISAENQLAAQGSGDLADDDADADANSLAGALPNYGLPGPGIGGLGGPSYPAPNYNYPMGSVLLDPFSAYALGGPYIPYAFFQPLIVIARPYGWRNSQWTHNATTAGARQGWPTTHPAGTYPSWIGVRSSYLPSARPFTVPLSRPLIVAPPRTVYSHPAVVPHAAPAAGGVRAIGHR